jgi:hypothetical protein
MFEDTQLTLTRYISPGALSIAKGFFAVSVANVGKKDAELLGTTLKKGEVVDFQARTGYGLQSIDFNPLNSELLISTTL